MTRTEYIQCVKVVSCLEVIQEEVSRIQTMVNRGEGDCYEDSLESLEHLVLSLANKLTKLKRIHRMKMRTRE